MSINPVNWIQTESAEIEAKIHAVMNSPKFALFNAFGEELRKESKNLYYKWVYGCLTFTNVERDTLAIVARRVRKTQGE